MATDPEAPEAETPPEGTLREDVNWLDVTCPSCGTPAKIAEPPAESHVKAAKVMVNATLDDGTIIPVEVTREVPRDEVLWECGKCGAKNVEGLDR